MRLAIKDLKTTMDWLKRIGSDTRMLVFVVITSFLATFSLEDGWLYHRALHSAAVYFFLLINHFGAYNKLKISAILKVN